MVSSISLLPLSAAILSAALALAAGFSPRRTSLPVVFFVGLNVSTFLWSLAYFVQLGWGQYADPALAPFGSPDYALLAITALGVAGAPTYWFLFATSAAHSRFWTTRWGVALAHAPLVYTVLVSLTNPWHHLFISELPNGLPGYGALGLPHFLGTYVLIFGGIWTLVRWSWSAGTAAGRRQAFMIAVASATPLLGGVAWAVGLFTNQPLPVNPVPVLFPVLNLVLGYQVLYRGLGDIVPLTTLQAIMEHTEAHLAYLDPRFNIVSANSAFIRRSGHTEGELLGHDYFELFPDPSLRSLFECARDNGEPVEQHDDPSIFRSVTDHAAAYWNWYLAPVKDQSGELLGFVLSLVDVTDTVRDRELSEVLNRLNARLHAGFTSNAVLREAVIEAAAALHVESSALVVLKEGRWRLMQRPERPDASWEPFAEEDFPHIAWAMGERQTLRVSDALNDDRLDPHMMGAHRLRAVLVVPFTAADQTFGAVSFNVYSAPRPFGDVQVSFAERFGSAVTLALQNARLYEGERRVAETLQESMLKLPERLPGVDFAHVYRSASESARVGGDFYDLFELGGGKVGVVIGDVAGHGVEAAVTTSLIKNTIRARTFEDVSPEPVMEKTNEIVRMQTDAEVYATAFFGVYDPRTGSLSYCSAGHPPSLLVTQQGEVRPLSARSTILGVFEGMSYPQGAARISPGDVLVMYTDGITEARRDGELFGEERLMEVLAKLDTRDPAKVVDIVFDAVLRFSGNELADDVAILALRPHPEGDAAAADPKRRRL